MIMCFTGWRFYHRPKGIQGRQCDGLTGRNLVYTEKFVKHENLYILNTIFSKLSYHNYERRGGDAQSLVEGDVSVKYVE